MTAERPDRTQLSLSARLRRLAADGHILAPDLIEAAADLERWTLKALDREPGSAEPFRAAWRDANLIFQAATGTKAY